MKKLVIATLSAMVLLPFAALGVESASAADEARVRVLHASPDAPAVDVYINGAEAISDLAYPNVTDYVPLSAGSYEVAVYAAAANGTGTPVIAATLDLTASTDYTVAAVGQLAAIEPLVLVDNNALPALGQAHLRFVHTSPNAPAVDIAAAGAGVVVPNAAFKDASGYLPLSAGSYDLSVLAAGTSTVALDLPDVKLESGKVYTAFALGLLGETPPLTAKVVVDAQASLPAAPSTGTGLVTDGSSTEMNLYILAGIALVGIALAVGVASTTFASATGRR
ncbi:MAG: DUF4397 domain-containing protein [Dehalococcoidia bacterium]